MANDLIVTDPTPVALNFDRLTKFDRSLTEAEARDVVRALDADSGKAGMAHAKTAAKLILGMYRTTEYADPQVFAAGLALTLSDFPLGVLRRVCDPRTGITGKLKFAPSVAEVKEACQAEIKNRETARRAAGLIIFYERMDREGITDTDPRRQMVLRESMEAVGLDREFQDNTWR